MDLELGNGNLQTVRRVNRLALPSSCHWPALPKFLNVAFHYVQGPSASRKDSSIPHKLAPEL